jgi:hypothetical protein
VFAALHKRQKSEADIAGSSDPRNRAQVISADLSAGLASVILEQLGIAHVATQGVD